MIDAPAACPAPSAPTCAACPAPLLRMHSASPFASLSCSANCWQRATCQPLSHRLSALSTRALLRSQSTHCLARWSCRVCTALWRCARLSTSSRIEHMTSLSADIRLRLSSTARTRCGGRCHSERGVWLAHLEGFASSQHGVHTFPKKLTAELSLLLVMCERCNLRLYPAQGVSLLRV